MTAFGYAVKTRAGTLLVRTLMDTERGAKINWLISEAGCVVARGTPDDLIDATFQRLAGEVGATVARVSIAEAPLQ